MSYILEYFKRWRHLEFSAKTFLMNEITITGFTEFHAVVENYDTLRTTFGGF